MSFFNVSILSSSSIIFFLKSISTLKWSLISFWIFLTLSSSPLSSFFSFSSCSKAILFFCSAISFSTKLISSFKLLIYSSYFSIISLSPSTTFFFIWIFIHLALFANCKVNIVSSKLRTAGDNVAINTMRPLPLRGSCKIRVSFDSLNGINFLFWETIKFIHLLKAKRDLFILPVSVKLLKLLFIEVFSLPAKSTK